MMEVIKMKCSFCNNQENLKPVKDGHVCDTCQAEIKNL